MDKEKKQLIVNYVRTQIEKNGFGEGLTREDLDAIMVLQLGIGEVLPEGREAIIRSMGKGNEQSLKEKMVIWANRAVDLEKAFGGDMSDRMVVVESFFNRVGCKNHPRK